MILYKQAFHGLREQLQSLYDAGEATAITKELLEGFTGITYAQSLTANAVIPAELMNALNYANLQLLQGRPLQQVLGYGWFMNRKFRVNEHVLIPRPETEELVDWILKDWATPNKPFSVLDIGTGSGCIPISLKLALDNATVTSCDISGQALAIANDNARKLQASITFQQLNFLDNTEQNALGSYDIIVSNPPYIPVAEQEAMHQNVRDYEPAVALFVPDNDPLLFYKAIAIFGKTHLQPGGAIYCELHKGYAIATEAYFKSAGYTTTELRKDINGHWRMLKATLS